MFTFNLLTNSLTSALEQFEIITLYFPDFGFMAKKFLWIYFPKEIMNNVSLALALVSMYILAATDLKTRGFYFGNYEKNKIKYFNSFVTGINSYNYKKNFNAFQSSLVIDNSKNENLTLEMAFVIYSFVNFVYNQILKNLTYGKNIFLNYALTLFIFLLICNIFGMIPYSLTVTSYLIITLNLSGMSFFGNLLLALRVHGLKFAKFFIPNGVTGPLLILMVVIEIISYIARLFSMAIRLFANMLSGHALIKILSGLVFLTFSDIYFFGIIHVFFNLVTLAVTALEVVVASLQAYVFVILSVVYTNESIVLH